MGHTVCCIDLRGHGKTVTADDSDLSAKTLAQDSVQVLLSLYGDQQEQQEQDKQQQQHLQQHIQEHPQHPQLLQQQKRKIVMVGHSLGGAIATRTALHFQQFPEITVSGLIVLDVVEGTALAALPTMKGVLHKRPTSFSSHEAAIQWFLSSGQLNNRESANLSVPAQLVPAPEKGFTWRTKLKESEPFWNEWFLGLSEQFLSFKGHKLLLLAGTDRLDKTLTIAQMQGKFQLQVLNIVGHHVQEDSPEVVASAVHSFLNKFKML